MDKSLFNFSQKKQHFVVPIHKNSNFLRKLLSNKLFIWLMTFTIIILIISLISFIFNGGVIPLLKELGIEKNIKPIFLRKNNLIETVYNPEVNEKIKLLVTFLEKNNIDYNIDYTKLVPKLSFNILDIINTKERFELLLGTNNLGESVLTSTMNKFAHSVLITMSIFIVELFIALPIGSFIPLNRRSFTICNVVFSYFIMVPDLVILMLLLVVVKNFFVLLTILLITGIFRLIYWTMQYCSAEIQKEYMIILVNSNLSKIALVYKHLIPKIISKILILFSARLGYIIGLISIINIIGFPIEWNVLNNIKENWKYLNDNIWQILFPIIHLTVFLLLFRLVIVSLARTIDTIK